MSHHATEKLADFIENLEFSDCNAEVIVAAKASLLDFIGVAIAGSREAQLNRLLMESLVQYDSRDDSTILGQSKKASAVHAALINATNGHSLDLDDGHRQALGHPGVCVVPAALSLGESIGSSGKQILTAIIAGYEKVQLICDPSYESKKDNIPGAEVEIILSENTSFRNKVRLPKGEPENPATIEELEEKFRSCIGYFCSEQKKRCDPLYQKFGTAQEYPNAYKVTSPRKKIFKSNNEIRHKRTKQDL